MGIVVILSGDRFDQFLLFLKKNMKMLRQW